MHLYSERRLRTSLELFKIKPVGDVENSIHQHFRKLQLDRIQIKKNAHKKIQKENTQQLPSAYNIP